MPFRTDRLLKIETKLEELAKENAELKRRMELSMRKDHVCPECEHGEVLYCESLAGSGPASKQIFHMSVWVKGTIRLTRVGEFEAYICRSCGFVEWYVKDLEELGQDEKSKEIIKIRKSKV